MLKESSPSGSSTTESAMLVAVKELTSEIRLFREVFMYAISRSKAPLRILDPNLSNRNRLYLRRRSEYRSRLGATLLLRCCDLS